MVTKVFIPQIVIRYDEAQQRMLPAHDFSHAEVFGQLFPILSQDDDPIFLSQLVNKIKESLKDFSQDDYLIAVGDPSVIAVCAGVILKKQDSLKLLKWDRKLRAYIPLEIKL